MNDIVDYESRYFSTQEYAGDLKTEFDMLTPNHQSVVA